MGEQIGTRLNRRSDACKFPSESIRKKRLLRPQGIKKSLNLHFRPSPILVAASLIIILMISALVWAWNVRLNLGTWIPEGMNPTPYEWDEGQWSLILILITILISIWVFGLKFNTSRRG
jgi:hypothetical protein